LKILVIPANAGIPLLLDGFDKSGTPAFAGVTMKSVASLAR